VLVYTFYSKTLQTLDQTGSENGNESEIC